MYLTRHTTAAFLLTLIAAILFVSPAPPIASAQSTPQERRAQEDREEEASNEDAFIANSRQLTFEGLRAGEGYFAADGQAMVFQSERLESNPFFQIFLLDFETGDVEQVSPGHGKNDLRLDSPGRQPCFVRVNSGRPRSQTETAG